jgi:hypothetical protein
MKRLMFKANLGLIFLSIIGILASNVFADDLTNKNYKGFRLITSEVVISDEDTINPASWQAKPTRAEMNSAIRDTILYYLTVVPDTNNVGQSIFRMSADLTTIPDSVNAPGTVGTMIYTSMYLYLCIKENTWAVTTLMPFQKRQ